MSRDTFPFRRLALLPLLGFSSGLPLLATSSTLQAWLFDQGVSLEAIGLFSLVGLPYSLKILWAPVLDRYVPPILGRRRGWMLITQLATGLALLLLGAIAKDGSSEVIALSAILVAFWSASQDIVLDAHRRDILHDKELGLGNALFVTGYRVGMLTSGALALVVASYVGWVFAYALLGLCMIIGCVASICAPEPELVPPPESLRRAVIDPIRSFLSHRRSMIVVIFVIIFRLGDTLAQTMLTPFVLKLGYSKMQLAQIGQTFGLLATLLGGLAGGLAMLRWGINRALWIFGALQCLSTLGFMILPLLPLQSLQLALVVGFENLCSGMGTAAFVALLARLTDKRYSATQFALLTCLMGIPRTLLGGTAGYLVTFLGWQGYFLGCAVAALPGMLLLHYVAPWQSPNESTEALTH